MRFSMVGAALIICAMVTLTHAEPRLHSFVEKPDTSIAIDVNYSSMNKSWPNRNYPDHIGMTSRPRNYVYVQPMLWSDRLEYRADDEVAQFFALFPDPAEGQTEERIIARLKDRAGKTLTTIESPATSGKVSFMLDLVDLQPGNYTMQLNWTPPKTLKPTWVVTREFTMTDATSAAPPFPADGVPVVLEKQDVLTDGAWPMTLGVPLPRGAVRDVSELTLLEDGKPVPADMYARARWAPGETASVQWIHLHFQGRYRNGKAADYKLIKRAIAAPDSSLKVTETADAITVDTGYVRFEVSRRAFSGIAKAWYDVTGKGNYTIHAPHIVGGAADGAYLVDQNGTRYNASADANVSVKLELDGDAQVTIAAEGWYVNPADPSDRLCKYVTRITAFPDQPMLRVSQNTYLTYDTWERQLADLGFTIPAAGGSQYRFGADGKTREGALPAGEETVYLHQERWDGFRVVGAADEAGGKQSDGWFTVGGVRGSDVSVVLRDIWQKYPKEVEMSRAGLGVHFWPKHGHNTFTSSEQLDYSNLYKFLCFHQGKLMDLKTPESYMERFVKYAEDNTSGPMEGSGRWFRESEHDATRDGRATGAVIANEFAVLFSDGRKDVSAEAKTFMHDPSALTPPQWNAATEALGPMAAATPGQFPEMEEALVEGWLGWGEGMVKRYKDYGMWNYADTHTIHNVGEERPGLHRVWQGSHYHNMGTNWLLYYRTADPRLLRWARKNVDHYLNIDMTNYVDTENPLSVRDHDLGGMQHMGWKTHWASSGEAWGQYKDVWGHFIDADSLVWTWYITGNPRAIENYDNWRNTLTSNLLGRYRGTAREFNTSLANMITAYTATWDPTWIPIIYEVADALADTPLEKQKPGPMWHPLWINRYHDLTRDPRYEQVITFYADYFKQGVESTWTCALASKAYDLTGDEYFLTMHLPRVRNWPRTFYRKPGDPYDWFGNGDGPLGGNYAYMTWGNYLLRLQRAGITELPVQNETTVLEGAYPYTAARWTHPAQTPSCLIYALSENSEEVVAKLGLRSLGGSLHATHAQMFSPDGEQAWSVKRVGSDDDKNTQLAAPGQPGLWRLEYHGHTARVPSPQTNLKYEAVVIHPETTYKTSNINAYMMPLDDSKPIRLMIGSASDRDPTSILLYDARGKLLMSESLFAPRPGQTDRVIVLHPRATPTPWRIDTIGMTSIRVEQGGDVLFAASMESLDVIARELAKGGPNIRKSQ